MQIVDTLRPSIGSARKLMPVKAVVIRRADDALCVGLVVVKAIVARTVRDVEGSSWGGHPRVCAVVVSIVEAPIVGFAHGAVEVQLVVDWVSVVSTIALTVKAVT